MKKNYFIISLCIALAICIAFLLWPEKQHDTHKDDKAQVVADNDTLKAHGLDYARANDSLTKEVALLKDENKKLREGQVIARRQLDLKTAEARSFAKEVQRNNRDTGDQARRIDSLVAQIESFAFLLSQYEACADSLNNVTDSMKIGYETVKKADDKRIAELQSAYDKLFTAYKDLFDTSASLQKDLRRQKLKTKIAAVLGAAAGVLGLIK